MRTVPRTAPRRVGDGAIRITAPLYLRSDRGRADATPGASGRHVIGEKDQPQPEPELGAAVTGMQDWNPARPPNLVLRLGLCGAHS